MRKGTTPKLTFTIPFDTSRIQCFRVVFAYRNEPILTKDEKSCSCSGNKITVPLTQEETFLFGCDSIHQVQMRVKLSDGSVINSEIIHISVDRCLDKEVL